MAADVFTQKGEHQQLRVVYGACPHDCPDTCALETLVDEQGPTAGKIVEGMQRDDLFTVVHELFLTDTARYADIVLPATSQLKQVDLHKPYGHLVEVV